MINFVGFMLFSTFEFIGLMFLVFAVFSFDWEYYKKEMLLTSVGMTLLSYIFVICHLEQLLLPVEIVVLILTFKIGYKEKWLYSLWITIAGLFTYLVIQIAILLISIQAGLITYADTSHTFGYKTYLLQSLTATIVITISSFIRYNKQGFGFTFRTKFNKRLYFMISLMSVIILSSCFYFYSIYSNFLMFYIALFVFVIFFSVLFFYSHKKDHEEFSFT